MYEKGLLYWPYKTSLQVVLDKINEFAPKKGCLLDIMCGPGYLLGQIADKFPNLELTGVDIDQRYIQYGHQTYPKAYFEEGDVLTWQPSKKFEVVICTGSIHHVPYEEQEDAIANISSMVTPGGVAIISDCYIDDYSNEMERKLAAAKLGYEYLCETIQNGAPDDVVSWTADILWNDVLKKEYKSSLAKRLSILKKYFHKVETIRAWPTQEESYGDYVHICW